jgi:hypothetical protein
MYDVALRLFVLAGCAAQLVHPSAKPAPAPAVHLTAGAALRLVDAGDPAERRAAVERLDRDFPPFAKVTVLAELADLCNGKERVRTARGEILTPKELVLRAQEAISLLTSVRSEATTSATAKELATAYRAGVVAQSSAARAVVDRRELGQKFGAAIAKGLRDQQSARDGAAAMQGFLLAWPPLGVSTSEFENAIGIRPTYIRGQVWFYVFDSGLTSTSFAFVIEEGRIQAVEVSAGA